MADYSRALERIALIDKALKMRIFEDAGSLCTLFRELTPRINDERREAGDPLIKTAESQSQAFNRARLVLPLLGFYLCARHKLFSFLGLRAHDVLRHVRLAQLLQGL